MATKEIQEQIDELNQKLDRVLEYVEIQHRKREEWDDLMKDLSLISKDAFNSTVTALDKAGVEIDSCGLQCLSIKILRNLNTFGEMIELMESAKDLFRDLTPILRQIGLDIISKMNELDQKGYLESFSNIARNLTNKETVDALERISHAMVAVNMDDKIDDKSFWQLFKQLRSREVRKSLSYSMRLLEAINKK